MLNGVHQPVAGPRELVAPQLLILALVPLLVPVLGYRRRQAESAVLGDYGGCAARVRIGSLDGHGTAGHARILVPSTIQAPIRDVLARVILSRFDMGPHHDLLGPVRVRVERVGVLVCIGMLGLETFLLFPFLLRPRDGLLVMPRLSAWCTGSQVEDGRLNGYAERHG